MLELQSLSFTIPGTALSLIYEINSVGQLMRLIGGDRIYFERREGEGWFGDGLAQVGEQQIGQSLLRRVQAAGETWLEEYRWSESGLPTWVDGTTIQRDRWGQITACISPEATWQYHYRDRTLVAIEGPSGRRRIGRDADGRPISIQQDGCEVAIAYDAHGQRLHLPEPNPHWVRDELGRLWLVRDANGQIQTTYLWHRFACLGRIDGALGDPLTAVFSLDPSLTPVRIITAERVTKIPRDAFGEGLLAYPDSPGLQGSAQHRGWFYLRSRVADPRTGSFHAPDPWHGAEDDPRRAKGYDGELWVDQTPTGPYSICRYDPVGYLDPTGEIPAPVSAALLSLSTLTWSSQHNLAGLFVLHGILNFWVALVTGKIRRWFDIEGIYSSYLGTYGFRFDPVGIESIGINKGRAWTYQHIIWSTAAEFEELQHARVFIPATRFEPSLYGTLLAIKPTYGKESGDPAVPFVLRGASLRPPISSGLMDQIPRRAMGWTRSGGAAVPTIPGSKLPRFPDGGLHFQEQEHTFTPQVGSITELKPGNPLLAGIVSDRKVLRINQTGLSLAVGNLLWLRDRSDQVEIVTIRAKVERDRKTHLRLESDPTLVANADLKVHQLSTAAADIATDTHNPGSQAGRLNAKGTSGSGVTYRPTDPLRLKQGAPLAVVGAAFVQRLEAQLQVDAALSRPSGPSPYKVYTAQATGTVRNVTVSGTQQLNFPAGQAPAVGSAIAIRGGGKSMFVQVSAGGSDDQRQCDRALDAAITGAAAGSVTWQILTILRPIGQWDGIAGSIQLTYTPDISGSAPNSGPVILRNQDNAVIGVREITTLNYDDLILSTNPLPGAAGLYTVERMTFQTNTPWDASLEDVRALTLPTPIAPPFTTHPHPALQIQQLDGAAIAAAIPTGTQVLQNLSLASNPVPVNPATHLSLSLGSTYAPTPGQLVILQDASGAVTPEVAVVDHVSVTVTLDRSLPFTGTALKLVSLTPSSVAYKAVLLPPNRVVLEPVAYKLAANGAIQLAAGVADTVEVQMPHFQTGELVRALWNTAGNPTYEYFRVKNNPEGTVLELEGGNYANLPAAPADLAIARLDPTDPQTGGPWRGIEGRLTAAAPSAQIQFKAWSLNAAPTNTILAITDGTRSLPAIVTSVDAGAVQFLSIPPSFSAVAAAHVVVPGLRGDPIYLADYTLEGNDLILPSSALTPGADLAIAIPFNPPAANVITAQGLLSSGTVMIPDDATESWQLTRRESLETHELRHTQQAAMMGPTLLALVPLWLMEAIADIAGADLDAPAFSPYVQGNLERDDTGNFLLDIPNPGSIDFETGKRVQIAQNTLLENPELGEKSGTRYRVNNVAMFQPGFVSVRLHQSDAASTAAKVYAGISVDSLGGLMTTLAGPFYGFIPWLVLQIIHAAKGNTFGTPYWLDFFPAQVSDPSRPASIQVSAVNGNTISLSPNDTVKIRANGIEQDTEVTAVTGNTVELKDAPINEGSDRRLQIAKLGESDPLGFYSDYLVNAMGIGGIRWIFDPWGQIQFRTAPEPNSAWDWVLKVARWGFGSTSWAGFPLGIFFFDNLIKNGVGKGHLSKMEQDASEMSGDLYSPLGRLYGKLNYVGDLARYWYYVAYRSQTLLERDRQDAPGIHFTPDLRLLPSTKDDPAAPAGTLNEQRVAAADSAIQVSDLLVQKNLSDPTQFSATAPAGFLPNHLGWIPAGPGLERTTGMYVTFTRPPFPSVAATPGGPTSSGLHTITVEDAISGASDALEAQKEGKQTIYFSQAVQDVTVTVAGQTYANSDVVELVKCQRVTFDVTPNGDRRYSISLLRPKSGDLLRQGGDRVLQVQTTNGTEAIEITRDHVVSPYSIQEDETRSWPQIHLLDQLQIPVRSLQIRVVDTLPVRTNLSLPLTTLPFAQPGMEAYILVPARIHRARPTQTQIYASPTPASITHPQPQVVPETTIPAALRSRLGDGGILKITFDPTDPPEEPVTLEWAIQVRATQTNAAGVAENISSTLKAQIELRPHFRLALPAGGEAIAIGAAASLVLTCTDGVLPGNVIVTPSEHMEVTKTGADVQIRPLPGAALGKHEVVVENASDPAQKARRSILVT